MIATHKTYATSRDHQDGLLAELMGMAMDGSGAIDSALAIRTDKSFRGHPVEHDREAG